MTEQATKADIVIIEDDLSIANFLRDLLEMDGYRVMSFADGTALAAVVVARPRLILLDLMLPELDGAEICRRLRADPHTRTTPIVMMTAASTTTIVQRLHGCVYNGLLRKPFDIDELLGIATLYIRDPYAPALLHYVASGGNSLLVSRRSPLLIRRGVPPAGGGVRSVRNPSGTSAAVALGR